MARLTNRERRKKRNRRAFLGVLCVMRVVNTVIQLYMLIMDLIAKRHRQRLRQRPHDLIVRNDYEKVHPKVKGLNGKHFPMYDNWCIIFGKDRAIGDFASDPADLESGEPNPIETPHLNEMFNECYAPQFANGEPLFPRGSLFVDIPTSFDNPIPATPPTNANTSTSNAMPERPKKKARVDPMEASIHEALGALLAQNNVALEKIAIGLAMDDGLNDLKNLKNGLWDDLMKIDMEMLDRFSAHALIMRADENVATYYNIPQHTRKFWVEAALAGKFQLK